jgi:ABC-type glutathione transport system ATPase component
VPCRIVIVGISGNGKTTLGRRLGIGAPSNLEIVRLRSPRKVERWLECQAPD